MLRAATHELKPWQERCEPGSSQPRGDNASWVLSLGPYYNLVQVLSLSECHSSVRQKLRSAVIYADQADGRSVLHRGAMASSSPTAASTFCPSGKTGADRANLLSKSEVTLLFMWYIIAKKTSKKPTEGRTVKTGSVLRSCSC